VRSALIGAIAGVLGVVGCFTFRAGINDAITSPQRSGVVWNWVVASGAGPVAPKTIAALAKTPQFAAVIHARWNRAVQVDGVTTPVFGSTTAKGDLSFVILNGRAPRTADEIAFAPVTMRGLGLHIGDRVKVGSGPGREVRVVGKALLPATSHTDYDQSGWMTTAGLRRSLPPASEQGDDAFEDYVLLKRAPGVSTAAVKKVLAHYGSANGGDGGESGYYVVPATLPSAVVDLGHVRTLPLTLGIFFALLACATVAHALVTTVRRRKHDLAILGTFGFTRRQTRIAIAWQATLLAAIGLLIGVPLGIVAGRLAWRWLANSFPMVYVPPLALLAMLLVIPVALVIANLLAAGPAHAATRIRPAEALRTE
jgi:predicted lysophospholipase L1 biosynthesis ABC-type transport system permease subunit